MVGAARSSCPAYRECREIAAQLQRSPGWRHARDVVRPRDVSGLFRDRAPLPVIIALAGREGRLVRDAAGGLAMLEPPTGGRNSSPTSALRVLDNAWSPTMALLPALALLGGAVPVAATAGGTAGAIVALVALVYVLFFLLLTGVRVGIALSRGRRRLADTAIGQLRAQTWTVILLHAPGGPTAAAALLDAARRDVVPARSRMLVSIDGITAGRPRSTTPGGLRIDPLSPGHRMLVCHRDTDTPWDLPSRGNAFRGAEVAVVLGGTVTMLAVGSRFVADDEARVCGDRCDGLPTTYGDALYWMASRLLGGDPDGLGVTSLGNRLIGVLVTVFGVYILVRIVGRILAQRMDEDLQSGRAVADEFERTHGRQAARPGAASRSRRRPRRVAGRGPADRSMNGQR